MDSFYTELTRQAQIKSLELHDEFKGLMSREVTYFQKRYNTPI